MAEILEAGITGTGASASLTTGAGAASEGASVEAGFFFLLLFFFAG